MGTEHHHGDDHPHGDGHGHGHGHGHGLNALDAVNAGARYKRPLAWAFAITAYVVHEAINRLGGDHEVTSTPVIVVAVLGLIINLIAFKLLLGRCPGKPQPPRDRHKINHATVQVEPADHAGCNLVQW